MTALYVDAGGPMPVRHSLIQSRLPALCQKTLVALAVGILLFAGCLTAKAAAADLTLMRVGYGGIAGYQLPLWVKNMLKAYVEAIRAIRRDKPASVKVLRKYLGITDDAAVEATYDFFSRRFEPIPRTGLDGIKHILKEMDAPQRNPADFLDRTLLDEIEKEGAEPKLQ